MFRHCIKDTLEDKEIVKMEELKKIIVELNSVFEELIPIEK